MISIHPFFKSRSRVFQIILLAIILVFVYIFRNHIVRLYHQYENSNLWTVITSIATLFAVFFAARSSTKAKEAIEISNKALNDQMRPVFLFSTLNGSGLRLNEDNHRYCIDLSFCNHGKGVALVRKIESNDSNFAAHISTPISIGAGDVTDITLFFDRAKLDEINKKYLDSDVGIYQVGEWSVEVRKKFIASFGEEPVNVVNLSRKFRLSIYYWSISGNCYKNEIELVITIKYNLHLFVCCFVDSERTIELPHMNGEIPAGVKQHDSIEY